MIRYDTLLFPLWLAGLAILLYLAAIPIDLHAQLWGAGAVLAALCVLHSYKQGVLRILFLFLAAFLSLRYFLWRTFSTLSYNDFWSFLAAVALYLAEMYGIILLLLGIFVNIHPLKRLPVAPPSDPQRLPTVDVLIPTYNEPLDLLEITLLAATQIRYPKDKLCIYLLDDGGTEQKCNDADPDKVTVAHNRRYLLRKLCKQVGAYYLTRDKNEHAKAGNINAALKQTNGELVLILDADHVPTVDILQKTVGWFERDPKLFLVQTPHFFINPTPIEKNLETFERMPGDNEMFYGVIQPGLDFWGASFFCGAAGVLRRQYLDEVGGICGSTITEDAETALALHSKGYRSAYINHPLIAGLSPETFTGFVVQRTRWAQGMTQIFLLNNPLLVKGLQIWQRLGYLNSSFFWFFGFARLIFLLAPSAYLLCGLKIYNANEMAICSYTLPHMLAVTWITQYLYGHVRWPFISELYELMQSVFTVHGIAKVLRNPHAPTFLVTPKGESVEEDFISPLSSPFYWLITIILASLAAGVYRYLTAATADRYMVIITMGWEVFNLFLTLAVLGALFERRQRRRTHRVPVDAPATVVANGHPIPCHINDASVGGVNLSIAQPEAQLLDQTMEATLLVHNAPLGKDSILHISTRNKRVVGQSMVFGAEFAHKSLQEMAEKVMFVYGDSTRWVQFLQKREKPIGVLRSLLFLLYSGLTYSADHLCTLLRTAWKTVTTTPKIAARRAFVPARIRGQEVRPVQLQKAA
jgi:cellulose synthase (UDP-forming)